MIAVKNEQFKSKDVDLKSLIIFKFDSIQYKKTDSINVKSENAAAIKAIVQHDAAVQLRTKSYTKRLSSSDRSSPIICAVWQRLASINGWNALQHVAAVVLNESGSISDDAAHAGISLATWSSVSTG